MRERLVGVGHAVGVLPFFTALPRLLEASSNSPDSLSSIVCSERSRALPMIQRIASAWPRSVRTSTGT